METSLIINYNLNCNTFYAYRTVTFYIEFVPLTEPLDKNTPIG